MPDKYQIILDIQNSQADTAARASTKLMKAYEQQCLAAAKAAQAALHGSGPGQTVQTGGAGAAGTQRAADAQVKALRTVEAQARKTAQSIDYLTQPHPGSGLKTVIADLDKLHASLAKDKSFYVGAGGTGAAKPGAYANVSAFLEKAKRERIAVEQPRLGMSGGEAIVDDGRHRLARLKELGVKHFPVSIPHEDAAAFQARFGAGSGIPSRATMAAAGGGGEPHIDVAVNKLAIDNVNKEIAVAKKLKAEKIKAAKETEDAKQKIYDQAMTDEHNRAVKAARKEQDQGERNVQAALKQAERKAIQLGKLEGGPAANAAKYRRKALSDEQAHAVAINRIQDVQNKRKIEGIAKGMGEQRLSFAEAIHSALGLETAFGKVALAGMAIGAVTASVKAMAQAFADAKKYSQDMAGGLLDTMKSLRQVAAVEGRATDKAFTREVAAFGAATGLGVQGGAQFREAFGGRANIVKGVTIGDQAGPGGALSEFDKFRLSAGRIASIKGIPESQAGDLFGNILKGEDFTKKDLRTGKVKGAEAATNRAMATLKILDAGAGLMNKLIPQFNELSAVLQSESELEGVIRGPGEAAVVTSVLAEAGEGDVATMARNLSQGLRKFEDKDRAKFFKEARITDKDSLLQAIEKSMTYFEAEVGKGVPIDTAIQQAGFSDQREKRAMQTVFKARDKVLKKQMERLRASEGPGGVEATRKEVEALGLGEVQQKAEIAAQQEQADLEQGEPGTPLALAVARAKVKMTRSETYKKPVENVARMVYSAMTLGTRGGADVEAEYRAVREMEQKVLSDPRTTQAQRAEIARQGPAEITAGNVVGNLYAGNPGPALASMFQSLLLNNEKYVMYLEQIAKSNEDMAKAEAARKAIPAPVPQPVAGPAPIAGR